MNKPKRQIIHLQIENVELHIKHSAHDGQPFLTLEIEAPKIKYLFDFNKALTQKIINAVKSEKEA